MSAGPDQLVEAIVLNRLEQGERYWRFQMLSPESGPLEALWRRSSKPTAPTPPDLFEEIEASLEGSHRSKALFFREHRCRHGRPGIARRYPTLEEASRFARTIWRNLLHAEHFPPLYRLCHNVFDAFATGIRPEVTHLKGLYLLARDEGYPVKEEWWANLPPEAQQEVASLLQRPLEEIELPEAVCRSHLSGLQRYLRAFSDIIVAE